MIALWSCLAAITVSHRLHVRHAMAMPGASPACINHSRGCLRSGVPGHPGTPLQHGDACGYCGVLGHNPGLPFDFAGL
jgi:hypothetical protein